MVVSEQAGYDFSPLLLLVIGCCNCLSTMVKNNNMFDKFVCMSVCLLSCSNFTLLPRHCSQPTSCTVPNAAFPLQNGTLFSPATIFLSF